MIHDIYIYYIVRGKALHIGSPKLIHPIHFHQGSADGVGVTVPNLISKLGFNDPPSRLYLGIG